MSSLRSRLLAGAMAATTVAFAIGGVVVHKLVDLRLARDTDQALSRVLDVAVRSAKIEVRNYAIARGRVNPELDFLASPTGRNDVFYVCRMSDGVLLDASDELREATATIDLPDATEDSARFGDFVLADGARARGAALAFFPDGRGPDDRRPGGRGPGSRRGRWPGLPPGDGPRGAGPGPDGSGLRPAGPGPGSEPDEVPAPAGAAPADGSPEDPTAGRDERLSRMLEEAFERRSGPLRLIVLQSIEPREASLRSLAGILVLTWLLTCLIGTSALWLTIHRGLRPLEELRLRIADLDFRRGGDPVEVPGAPEELAPVVAQLEESRKRIVAAFHREQRFAGDAAHELRTPVSGIQAILEVALRRERSAEEMRGYAEQCLGIAVEMGRAVEALLMLGKLARGEVALELQDVDLAALVAEAWKPVAHLARERGVTLEVGGDGATITANGKLLMRAVANLVDNAVEYGDAPGVVRVEHVRGPAGSVIEISNAMTSPPEGLAEHAFEPFWRGEFARTDAARHAGLGLALVNQIAELHGGEASLEAADGRIVARVVLPDA